MKSFEIIRTKRVPAPTPCTWPKHREPRDWINTGNPITLVVDRKLALDAPNDPKARFYVCDQCLGSIPNLVAPDREYEEILSPEGTSELVEVVPW